MLEDRETTESGNLGDQVSITVELGTELWTLRPPQRDHRKSKFGLRHAIKLNLALPVLHDEVRILIFDDPAEIDPSTSTYYSIVNRGRNVVRNLNPGRVNCQTRAGAPRARALHEIFFENLRNPARGRRAGAMHQFLSNQLDSMYTTKFSY
jgi:hypothetical protein